jgi:hypothetical protein
VNNLIMGGAVLGAFALLAFAFRRFLAGVRANMAAERRAEEDAARAEADEIVAAPPRARDELARRLRNKGL